MHKVKITDWKKPNLQKSSRPWTSDSARNAARALLFGFTLGRAEDISKALAVVSGEHFPEDLRPIYEVIVERFEQGKSIEVRHLIDEEPRFNQCFLSRADIAIAESEAEMSSLLFHKALYVREQYIKDSMVTMMSDKVMRLEAGEDVFDIMLETEQEVASLYPTDIQGGLVDVGTIVFNEINNAFMPREEKEKLYLKSGFESVDDRIKGFMPGEFVIIGARPGMGKTGFGVSLSLNLVRQNVPHAFFEVEMTKEQLTRRYISQLTGVPVTTLSFGDMNKVLRLNSLLSIDDSSEATPTYIRNRTKQLIAERGIKLVIVDYLQKLPSGGKFQSREQEVSYLSGQLAKLAKDCNIVVVAFVQLNRTVEGRQDKRPSLADIRDSGSVEQDAHKVAFLYRPEYYNVLEFENGEDAAGMAELDWQKNRDGNIGKCRMCFDDKLTRFRDKPQNITWNEPPTLNSYRSYNNS
jgi:replicative DNA helicase